MSRPHPLRGRPAPAGRGAARPAGRRAAPLALLLAVVLVGMAGTAPVAAQREAGAAERVLVVSAPRLTWARIEEARPPALGALLERSALASMSIRTIGAVTDPAESYATIGAGNRATADPVAGGAALSAGEPVEGGDAADVFQRRTGAPADGAVLHLGVAEVLRRNEALRYDAEPGLLGDALADAGRRAAVVANADPGRGDDVPLAREAALAVMDGIGRVDGGTVAPELLLDDPTAPFGVRVDVDAAAEAVEAALATSDVVLLELSDLERADAHAALSTPAAAAAAHERALEWSDDLLGRALEAVDPARDLVVLLAPTSPSGRPAGLTAFAIAGPGIEPGRATSASTRRPGYVTLPDVAPTVLDALAVEVPPEATGGLVTARPGPTGPAAWADLADADERARFRDRVAGPAAVMFVALQVVIYLLAAYAIATNRRRLHRALGPPALVVLAMPPVGFLSGLVDHRGLGVVGFLAVLLAGAVALAVAAHGVGVVVARRGRRRLGALGPPLLLAALDVVVLVGDVATGGALQLDTVFGYSPIVAGRFAGYGNLAFALLAMAAIVVATGLWAVPRLAGRSGRRVEVGSLVVAAVVLLLAVVADGHPSLGSDVGGVLATVPGFAVVLLLLAGVRVGVGRALAIAGATVAVLAGFTALDLARSAADRTHLGRLVTRTLDAGGGGFATVIERKLLTNVSILVSSVWTLIIPVAFVLLAVLAWRRAGAIGDLQDRVPGLRACLVGGTVVGVLGFALNDSGVAVPAMLLGVLLPHVTYLAVRTAEP